MPPARAPVDDASLRSWSRCRCRCRSLMPVSGSSSFEQTTIAKHPQAGCELRGPSLNLLPCNLGVARPPLGVASTKTKPLLINLEEIKPTLPWIGNSVVFVLLGLCMDQSGRGFCFRRLEGAKWHSLTNPNMNGPKERSHWSNTV